MWFRHTLKCLELHLTIPWKNVISPSVSMTRLHKHWQWFNFHSDVTSGRAGRICRVLHSHAGGPVFGSQSSKTEDLYNCYLLLPSLAPKIIRTSKSRLNHYQDNVSEWDIRYWWWPVAWFPSGAALSSHHECTVSKADTDPDMTSDVARTYNSSIQLLNMETNDTTSSVLEWLFV